MTVNKDEVTEFSQEVIRLIKAIPEGNVATYGLIAALAGSPRAARQVGWLLHSSTQKHQLPWHRVIKSSGQLSFPPHSEAYEYQKGLLEMEGIVMLGGRVDLQQYLWSES
ncbi:MGMT family protein [Legionella lytica]|uniref:MGMT family protein n=1 Tax=Legionella lytica TaxID=96232 RepID=A0ABW8DA79_9GAMM